MRTEIAKVMRVAGMVGAMAGLTVAAGFADVAAAGHRSLSSACTASAAQSAGYWWLKVSDTGLSPSTWYSVFGVQPNGKQIGTAAYTDSSGYLVTTSLMALYPGTYGITVNRFHGGSVIASCGVTVP